MFDDRTNQKNCQKQEKKKKNYPVKSIHPPIHFMRGSFSRSTHVVQSQETTLISGVRKLLSNEFKLN